MSKEEEIMRWITEPWPWYVAGPMITLVMFLMSYFGKKFGVSSNLRTLCTVGGAGKFSDFFDFDWKKESWNLLFIAGGIIGGFIASTFMQGNEAVVLSDTIVTELQAYGMEQPGATLVPTEIFSFEGLLSWKGFIMLILGGFFVGFGTRYAGGCTSGHAITGLSFLQWPSLIAVIGFFLGGLLTAYFILPYVLSL
jgi:uncharacterized membrane protein YedE/YeeE